LIRRIVLIILISLFKFVLFSEEQNIPNGTIIKKMTDSGYKITIRKHHQSITIDYSASASQLIVFDSPISRKEVGKLQKKDRVLIEEIYIIDKKEIWLKLSSSRIYGFILFDQASEGVVYDYYEDGLWQPVDIIQSKEKTWHILKCDQGFNVYTNLNIRDKPGLSGQKIGIIKANQSSYVAVKTIEVTTEEEKIDGITERWAKIKYGGITGWVFAGYLEYERGGPRFNTPESQFEMSLGAGP
jgi:hypothetical protein